MSHFKLPLGKCRGTGGVSQPHWHTVACRAAVGHLAPGSYPTLVNLWRRWPVGSLRKTKVAPKQVGKWASTAHASVRKWASGARIFVSALSALSASLLRGISSPPLFFWGERDLPHLPYFPRIGFESLISKIQPSGFIMTGLRLLEHTQAGRTLRNRMIRASKHLLKPTPPKI